MNLHNPAVTITDPQEALNLLKEGNARYVAGNGIARDTDANDRDATKASQHPFAAVITCADSRCSPEIYFDQKIGDLFVLRNAGNIADDTVIGSLEFAVAALKAPLVVVVGHTQCGAVHNAAAGTSGLPEKLQNILDGIRSGLEPNPEKEPSVDVNVANQVAILKANPVISGVPIYGAKYNVETGEVTF